MLFLNFSLYIKGYKINVKKRSMSEREWSAKIHAIAKGTQQQQQGIF